MSGKSSGVDTGNGSAKSRDHNQGNQDRSYTVEQKAAVLRVRRCSATAFYDILGLESVKTTVTESEIKKAYRKLSLLTHPDKNGHEHADEAFKMVSRAFGVLGDPDKKAKFDKFGGDPDSRFGGGSAPQNPFSGFASASRGGGGGGGGGGGMPRGFEEEMSPEEMFRRFFGGGGMGGFGGGPFGGGVFDAGPQFVFNMGGGPGIRVHQFGGARLQRRPRDPNAQQEPPQSLRSTIMGLLPLLVLFVIPMLSSLFSGSSSTAAGPSMRFDKAVPPNTMQRTTAQYKIDYWLNPTEVEHYSLSKLRTLDKTAEYKFIQQLRIGCEEENDHRQRLMNEAQGWFFQDPDKMQRARTMEMKNCKKLDEMDRARY